MFHLYINLVPTPVTRIINCTSSNLTVFFPKILRARSLFTVLLFSVYRPASPRTDRIVFVQKRSRQSLTLARVWTSVSQRSDASDQLHFVDFVGDDS